MELLRVEGLSKAYGRRWVLKDISFELSQGESLALVGANGAGKSTLIKVLIGLAFAQRGKATLMGYELSDPRARSSIGYLPENPMSWPELDGRELLMFFGKMRGIPSTQLKPKVEALLEQVGLLSRSNRRMQGFSKGMQQRLMIAQALLHSPRLLILDEPMSGLDPRAQEKLRLLLVDQQQQKGVSMIISSHSLEDIQKLSSKVLVIEQGSISMRGASAEVIAQLKEKFQSSEPWDEDPMAGI